MYFSLVFVSLPLSLSLTRTTKVEKKERKNCYTWHLIKSSNHHHKLIPLYNLSVNPTTLSLSLSTKQNENVFYLSLRLREKPLNEREREKRTYSIPLNVQCCFNAASIQSYRFSFSLYICFRYDIPYQIYK